MSVVNVVLQVAQDFSRYPGPRFERDGPFSGEKFRNELLVPALIEAEKKGDKVIVNLDGARGYTASFLEEAFGGLIRESGFTLQQLHNLLEVTASDPRVRYWRDRIMLYMANADAIADQSAGAVR